MSAFSTEVTVEAFKFLPRYTLDDLLLICRQWNHLIRRFERQLHVRRLGVLIHIYSEKTTVEIVRANGTHPIDPALNHKKCLEYSHPENQIICPEGPHKALFSFLDFHIRNSIVEYITLTPTVPSGVMCLIKDLIDGQTQRNCFIASLRHSGGENVLNPEISLTELLKASFMSADKSFSLINPNKDAIRSLIGIGPFMTLVDHCSVVFSTTNHLRKQAQELEVSWQFNHNFPEQLIEIFKNSQKDDWPEHIVVKPITQFAKPYPNELSRLERQYSSIDRSSLLEYIWPNANEICPDLRDRPMEIVHPNPEDGRRLTIVFTMIKPMNRLDQDIDSDYVCSFAFKTLS
ncbi:hypothetical protein DdX_15825 [Ditylenchus destructor]|uniref:F-box domain-containing protein n=1 Tax=Ditylenchus destructor TaxID=166010 RepID=A0AAD4QXC7_9BILA|nr:hypothetical protein DdX_15825 [Ditylenchus destructor]